MPLNRKQQQGFSLLEALVAMVLTSIIALGGALSVGKIMQVQRQSNLQQIAMNQLRLMLQNEGSKLCGDTSQTITVNSEILKVTSQCNEQTTITVNGDEIILPNPIKVPILEVKDEDGEDDVEKLFGGSIKVGESL